MGERTTQVMVGILVVEDEKGEVISLLVKKKVITAGRGISGAGCGANLKLSLGGIRKRGEAKPWFIGGR